MQIGQIIHLGEDPSWYLKEEPNSKSHPHTIGSWGGNNTLYLASDKLDAFGLKDYYILPIPKTAATATYCLTLPLTMFLINLFFE